MRHYTYVAMRHGHVMEFWPPRGASAPASRIRVAAAVLFRKYFGRACDPRFSWHSDGFMAEAGDRQGRRIQVEQTNYSDAEIAARRPHIPVFFTGALAHLQRRKFRAPVYRDEVALALRREERAS